MTINSNRQDMSTSESPVEPHPRASLGLRWLSAFVLMPTAVLATWQGGWLLSVLVAVIAVLMAFEWNRLIYGSSATIYFIAHAVISVFVIVLLQIDLPIQAVAVTIIGAVCIALLSFAMSGIIFWPLLGTMYTTLPCLGFVWIRGLPDYGLQIAISLLFVIWATDTGAYLAGRTIGGPKLLPRLSPSKTWAGLGGAVFSASVFAGGAAFLWGVAPPFLYAAIGAFLGLFGQLGDFAESAVKRHFRAKDTSGFIPGHGGVLDRLDGLIFAVLAVSLIMLLSSL